MRRWNGYEYVDDGVGLAQVSSTHISCGVYQVYGLERRTPKNALMAIAKAYLDNYRGAFYVWSDTNTAVAKYIDKHMGGIIWSKPKRNPNSGNRIWVFVWPVKAAKLRAWYKKNSGE
jgi:hypothetical protein